HPPCHIPPYARPPVFDCPYPRERNTLAKDTTSWTPAISLITGLREALAMILEEGLPRVFTRHAYMAAATRAAAGALGLRLVAPEAPSPALTAIFAPPDVDGGKLVAYLRDRMGVTFMGGQDQLKGKIVRIGHLGYTGTLHIVTAMAAFEM